MKPLYEVFDVRVRFGTAEVLRGLSFEVRPAEMLAIVGPNGAGKSTLLSVIAGVRERYEGRCLFQGKDVHKWNKRALARQVAFVPQTVRVEFPFTAEQVVSMGRAPHARGLFESPDDHAAVSKALAATDATRFAGLEFRSLSGGERQRVLLAGALAQEPSVLLLDEPTTFLDLKHQVQTYALLRDLCRQGLTVIAVTHDLNLAAAYAERIVVLSEGRVAADAAPAAVLRPDLLRDVFGVEAEIRSGPAGRPWVLYGPC